MSKKGDVSTSEAAEPLRAEIVAADGSQVGEVAPEQATKKSKGKGKTESSEGWDEGVKGKEKTMW